MARRYMENSLEVSEFITKNPEFKKTLEAIKSLKLEGDHAFLNSSFLVHQEDCTLEEVSIWVELEGWYSSGLSKEDVVEEEQKFLLSNMNKIVEGLKGLDCRKCINF